jgi:hypothetical protein
VVRAALDKMAQRNEDRIFDAPAALDTLNLS